MKPRKEIVNDKGADPTGPIGRDAEEAQRVSTEDNSNLKRQLEISENNAKYWHETYEKEKAKEDGIDYVTLLAVAGLIAVALFIPEHADYAVVAIAGLVTRLYK